MNITFSCLRPSNLISSWQRPTVAQPSRQRESHQAMSEAEQARMNRALMHDRMGYHTKSVQSELGLIFLMTRFPIL